MPRMRRYFNRIVPAQPKSDLNLTPFIDVLLVLLVMLILTMPIAKHSTEVDLPQRGTELPSQDINFLRITEAGTLLWNGEPTDHASLAATVRRLATRADQPVLRFAPDAKASYDTSAKTIALLKDAGAEKLAFVGLHEHRTFGK